MGAQLQLLRELEDGFIRSFFNTLLYSRNGIFSVRHRCGCVLSTKVNVVRNRFKVTRITDSAGRILGAARNV